MSLDDSILNNLGGLQNNSLLHLLDNNQPNQEEEPALISHSPYVDNEILISIMKSKPEVIKCLSLNIQSLNAKIHQLRIYIEQLQLESCSFDFILLQETWLSENSNTELLQINGYQLITQSCKSTTHGGLAIYIKNDIDYELLSIETSNSNIWEGLFIKAKISNHKCITLGSIYRPPRNTIENYTIFMTEFSSALKQLNGEVIIGGDTNVDLLKINERPIFHEIFESVISNGFIPKITLPTRLSRTNGTLIDNFFCKISSNFSQTTAGICTYKISDHQPYFISLDFLKTINKPTKFVKITHYSDSAVNELKNYIKEEKITEQLIQLNTENPNSLYELFNNVLQKGIDKYMPTKLVKYNKHKHKKNPWITAGLIKSIKFRDKMYIRLKKTSQDLPLYNQLKTNLNTYNSILKKAIREAQKQYYHVSFNKYKNDIKNTWNTIKTIINKSKNVHKMSDYFLINNTKITDKQIIAGEFNKFFTNIGKTLAENICIPPGRSHLDYLNEPCNQRLTFKKLLPIDTLKIINNLQSKPSKGHDHVSNVLLKSLKNELIDPLTHILNSSFETGIFPAKLKIAKVLPIFKKGEESLLENYRPISILPSISKVFEKAICNQLNTYFKENNLYHNSQYGFRESHSTEHAVLEVIDKVIFSMDEGDVPLNIYMDLSKAFDTIDHDILIQKLDYYGIKDTSLMLIKDYLTDRQQYVELDDHKSTMLSISTGVPQGSILGPILFIIYINDISVCSQLFEFISYADDTTLFISLKYNAHLNTNETTINNELNSVSTWLKLNKLSLNISKTKVMAFHTSKRDLRLPQLYIDNTVVEYVDQFSLLGIVIDKNLSWVPHVNHITKKIAKTICIMKKLKHFLPETTLKIIYNSLINSYLNYGILCWGYKASKISVLQKKAIRTITSSKYNAHTQPLFKRLNILTVQDILIRKLYKFYYKLCHNLLPQYFKNRHFLQQNTHSHDTRNQYFIIPRTKNKFSENCIRYQLPLELNKNIKCIRDKVATHSEFGFAFYIKRYLISKYSENCTIDSCYICNNNQ